MFEMLGRRREDQQRQPFSLRVGDDIIEPLTDWVRAAKLMMRLEQSVAPF
jgi:hypothetical protein